MRGSTVLAIFIACLAINAAVDTVKEYKLEQSRIELQIKKREDFLTTFAWFDALNKSTLESACDKGFASSSVLQEDEFAVLNKLCNMR